MMRELSLLVELSFQSKKNMKELHVSKLTCFLLRKVQGIFN